MKALLVDNYDSFTYLLRDYIAQCNVECLVLRNDDSALLDIVPTEFDALVISPGPETPVEAGLLNRLLPLWIHARPVLGICLGHQAIGVFFGASLVKAKLPRHGKTDLLQHNGSVLFKGVPRAFKATRYHSLLLENLPPVLQITCYCDEEIMAFEHKTLPVWGLQFHPESCQTAGGLQMLKNFFKEVKKITHT